MAASYYGGPTGNLSGGSAYAFQVQGVDKDTWTQGETKLTIGNLNHAIYTVSGGNNNILTSSSIEMSSSDLGQGMILWTISGLIVNPQENGEPITDTFFLYYKNHDETTIEVLKDSDTQIQFQPFTVVGN